MDLDTILENFECLQCGDCCRGRGDVLLTGGDISAIAAALGEGEDEFIQRHTRIAGNRAGLALADKPNGDCSMLAAEGRCRINDVKPAQCRGFPYTWRNPDSLERCAGLRKFCLDTARPNMANLKPI